MRQILPDMLEDNSYKYILLDDKYISSICIKEYPKQSNFIEIIDSIPKDFVYDMVIEIEKKDTMDVLKKLSYQITNFTTEINSSNKNQIDLDILQVSNNDAKELRKDIQINNEEVYQVSVYITFFHKNLNELFSIIKSFQSKLYSKQIISNITNFRHLDSYIKTLPYIDVSSKSNNYKFLTTSALANMFPFYINNITDENGIVLGTTKDENKLCILDVFDDKYLNSNMCIFGSSGSGKSFFTKLYILKQFLCSKYQLIFDPEAEYQNLISNLKGVYFSNKLNNHINLLEIDKEEIDLWDKNFFTNKVEQVLNFICSLLNVDKESEIKCLKTAIIDAYKSKNITEDVSSVYKNNNNSVIYFENVIIDSYTFPTLQDVYNNIKLVGLKKSFKENILEKIKFICSHTNIDKECKLFGVDLSDFKTSMSAIIIRYFINKEIEKLKFRKINNKFSLIYIDEVWKYINKNLENNISDVIFSLYKTIRKQGASIVLITQDISDLFMGENLDYAKSILNNSQFKLFFKLEYTDIEALKNISSIDKEDIVNISKLEKGNVYLMFNSNKVQIKIDASDYEIDLIKGGM